MAFENEKDDFWDLSRIVPKKRPLTKFLTENPVRDYVITGDESKSENENRRLSYSDSEKTDESEESYVPDWSTLIKRVTVRKKTDKYDFYDSFRKSAILYFDVSAPPCDFAQFYSYMPQYSQLKESQKSYYFYWRSEIRRGRYIKTDYSYLYLAVYEIINLPDLIPPNKGIEMLVDLWRAYRRELPRIDFYFSIWIQDYCLIHKLPCPTDALSDFIFEILPSSPLKEFYLTDIGGAGERGLMTLLAYLSSYDYRKGKFVSGNPDAPEDKRKRQAELYRAHMNGALSEVFKRNVEGSLSRNSSENVREIVRDSFPNSLATHTVKSRLSIEYHSLADDPEVSERVTAAVRYAENRMRALIGVKSRLSVKGLPDDYKRTIDGYFDVLDARERAIRAKESEPEYEKLYAAPIERLSVESADKIEAISWMTTARLVEGDEDEWREDIPPSEEYITGPSEAKTEEKCETVYTMGLSGDDIAFIASLVGFDGNKYGKIPVGILRDEAKDRINEAFYDSFGDVIIDECDGEFTIIEDYTEDLKAWLLKITE